MGDDPEYPVSVLENAVEDTDRHSFESQEIDKRYSDNTPEGWDHEEWSEIINDANAPAKATLTTKSINGNNYYYYQWRDGKRIKSEYLAPMKE